MRPSTRQARISSFDRATENVISKNMITETLARKDFVPVCDYKLRWIAKRGELGCVMKGSRVLYRVFV